MQAETSWRIWCLPMLTFLRSELSNVHKGFLVGDSASHRVETRQPSLAQALVRHAAGVGACEEEGRAEAIFGDSVAMAAVDAFDEAVQAKPAR